MKKQAIKSVFSPTNIDILASPALDQAYVEMERQFKGLSLEEKGELIILHRPNIYQVETTTRCNLNCPLCSTHHLKRGATEARQEIIKRIVDDNPQITYMCLHLMGEPLLSRSIFSIIEYLRSKAIYTYFSTNGMLLEEKVQEILSCGLDKISISLDGINQEDLARYRVNADLDRILRGIRRLKEERDAKNLKRPLIQIQTIMFSYNEVKENRIIRFLKSLGIDRIKLKKPGFDTFGGKNDGAERFKMACGDTGCRYSRKSQGYVRYKDRAVCRLLFQGFVLSDGSVVPCCIDYDGKYPFGNLYHQAWNEIWTSEERQKILTRYFSGELELCRKCSLGYDYSTTVFDKAL
jgi:radical SAM protein with 4Fe4S-binding SPASM domain